MEAIDEVTPYTPILASHTSKPAYGETPVNLYMQQINMRDDNIDLQKQQKERPEWPGFIIGSEDSWGGDTERKRRTYWADLMGGIIPVHTEFWDDNNWGDHPVTPQVKTMFDWFYGNVAYRHPEWNILNELTGEENLSVLTSGIPDTQYVTYSVSGGSISVDLSGTSADYESSWLNPVTGEEYANTETVSGGETREITAPFSGECVLLLERAGVTKASAGESPRSLNARSAPILHVFPGTSKWTTPSIGQNKARVDLRGRMLDPGRRKPAK
jgi:hypothetical protein